MAPRDPRPPHDELVSHAGFLRALARGMLADEHLAEDVVQQAFLRALARPPAERGFLGAWLARVVRNLALNARRGEERRSARERMAARDEVDAAHERATLELLLQREVAAALAELGEPYRAVVHLRYFRSLSVARIAEELALTPKVVETRLARAHELLRRRLARAWDEQDERARALWLAALPSAGKILGGVLMTKQLVLVGVGGALLVGLVFTWRAFEVSPARGEAPALVVEPSPVPAEAPRVEAERGEAREEVALAPEVVPSAPGEAPTTTPEAELATALDRLAFVIDRSLEGRMDPGVILEAALLVAAYEPGRPRLEPDQAGRIVIPLVGMPEGVEAELCVKEANSSALKGLSLQIRLERHEPLVVGNFERELPEVQLTTWTNEGGELTRFSISIDAAPDRRVGDFTQDPSDSIYGVSLGTPLTDPTQWKLEAHGLRAVEGSEQPDGGRSFKSGSWEVPQVLEGGPWPRVDDIRRFGARLQELHALAKARSAR